MPYGRPSAGGLGLLHRYVEVGWSDPGASTPARPDSFYSDFVEVNPQEIYIARLNTQITGADGANTAILAVGIEDDAGGLSFTQVSGPITSADGNSGGFIFEFDFMFVGLAAPNNVRASFTGGWSAGPPLVPQPAPANSSGLYAWPAIALNSNLLRIVIGAINGSLIGNASGYIAQGTGG